MAVSRPNLSPLSDPVILYVRKSRALGDPDDPELLRNMLSSLYALVKRDGHDPDRAQVIEEIGSGERIDTRPRFRELLDNLLLARHKGGCLYVTELARITRGNLIDMARVEEAFLHAGIDVQTRRKRYVLSDPDQLEEWEDELRYGHRELRRIKERLASGKTEVRRRGGLVTGRPSMGYDWDHKEKLPVPNGEFALLQYLCREAITHSIAQLAVETGVSEDRIRTALRNPMICGWPAQRYFGQGGKPRRRYDADGSEVWRWPEEPGNYPAAISRAEWETLQAAIDRRYRERSKRDSSRGWCRDVLQFAGAPGRVSLGCTHAPNADPEPTYKLRRPNGPPLYVARAVVHEWAEGALQTAFSRPQALASAIDAQQATYAARAPHAPAEAAIASFTRALRELRQEADDIALAEIRERDAEAKSGWTRLRRKKLKEIAIVKEQLARAQEAPPVVDVDLVQIGPLLLSVAEHWEEVWNGTDAEALTDDDRRAIVGAVFERIEVTVTPGRGKYHWRREVTGFAYRPWLAAIMTKSG